MTKINTSKEEALRIRVYAFFNKNKKLGKMFTVRHFMAENVPRSTIYDILKRSEYFPPERKQGSGQTPQKMTKVQLNKLKKAFDHKDNISQRQAAKKFDISQQMVSNLLKKLQITPRKKMKIPDRTEEQKKVARAKCRNLYLKNPNISWILDDESYFTLSHGKINGNDTFYSSNVAATSPSIKYTPVKKFEQKLLVWLVISERGISAPIIRKSGLAVNQKVYLDFIKRGVIPFIKKHHSDGNYKFWPDLASSHYANSVVSYLNDQNIKFVPKHENPANVPEVRPIEDFWSILKGKVYENGWRAENLDLLRNKIRLCIRNMDQNLVQDLLASTSKRLDKIRRNGLIEKR
jgi:transposase